MLRWIFKLFMIGLVGVIGYGTYDLYRGGFFNMPDMPTGSYAFSFTGGFRGIVLDAEASEKIGADMPKFWRTIYLANPDRNYLGVPMDVAPWMSTAWSTCILPSEEARIYFDENMPDHWKEKLTYARFDAVCSVEVDGKNVLRGLLYSVPKL